MNRRRAFWWVLGIMLVLDQVTKLWARTALHEGQALAIPWPGVFELTLTYNRGIAFGLLQGLGVLLAPIAIAIFAGSVWYNLRHAHEPAWGHVAASLLASGAIGNLYDRLVHGRVTDMLWFRLIDFPVFNVADACITIAAGMLILSWIREAAGPPAMVREEPIPAAETSLAPVE